MDAMLLPPLPGLLPRYTATACHNRCVLSPHHSCRRVVRGLALPLADNHIKARTCAVLMLLLLCPYLLPQTRLVHNGPPNPCTTWCFSTEDGCRRAIPSNAAPHTSERSSRTECRRAATH